LNYHVVDLTAQEKEIAMDEALRRHSQSKQLKQKPRQNGPAQDENGLRIDIAGAMGEMAVAKFLGLKQYVFVFNKNWGVYDLPPNLDVKTAQGHMRRLHIFLDENPSKIFVHATYKYEQLRVHGWSYGGDVMQSKFIDNPLGRGPSYFVTNDALRQMDELQAIVSDLGIAS